MIELKNINKKYGKTTAVKDVSLNCEENSTTVLIGPSGCGKSTTIRIITGLVNTDSGELNIDGETISSKNINKFRHKMGYVIQDGGLFPHLTARDNVSIMAKFFKWDSIKTKERVEELSILTKFPKEGLNKFPAQLSGGQKQRVSLMRALMLDPEFLLLDEPLGALDPMIRYDLQTDLKEIFTKLNKTVVMVTHDLSEAAYFADKIVLMKQGEIIQTGKPSDLFDKPENDFVEKFVNAQRTHLELN